MNRMKQLRERVGMSRSQFSSTFHIPVRTLTAWENETRTPPQYIIELLEIVIERGVNNG